ncbi:MAG TPA: molybdopterin-dependent oxidoreductase [Bryobacteraceae bacterium]|jgi:DMSO/TMAO reductase YedYZ molybdopterin-dependent catalytic subunit
MTNRRPEIVLPEAELQRLLSAKTRRGFLIGGLAALGAAGGYEFVTSAAKDRHTPWPQRNVLDFNAKLAHAYLSDDHLMPTFPLSAVGNLKPNGAYGLDDDVSESDKNLRLDAGAGQTVGLHLSDVQALPKVEMVTNFCCIEGWNNVAHWGGARFSDFTRKYFPPGRALPQYVYMSTPDEEYFVGLDMKSALHPQTLLAYEQNGKPLLPEHGAPLRLVIPVKYGIKNIKRIGLIRYTDKKPEDYWANFGYDWFAGL